jgi:hypothetical protein
MAELIFSSLPIDGYDDLPTPNLFLRLKDNPVRHETRWLALVFPGMRYSCDMPLLYYPTQLLLQQGIDVLQLHPDYTIPEFQNASPQVQAQWLATDALAAVQAGRAESGAERLILVGKSVGTITMAYVLNAEPGSVAIWLTPILREPALVEAAKRFSGPSLFIAGTGDTTYDAPTLARIREVTGAEAFLIEAANHSLEIPGEILSAPKIMSQILVGMADFLTHHCK